MRGAQEEDLHGAVLKDLHGPNDIDGVVSEWTEIKVGMSVVRVGELGSSAAVAEEGEL